MGVPSLYNWLLTTFGADLMTKAFDQENRPIRNFSLDVDSLYLDMNGIIHPSCCPAVGNAPNDEMEMLRNMLQYLDRLVRVMKPKSLLYLSVDGVAPRAKINQQRSRRFCSADDTNLKQQAQELQVQYWETKLNSLISRRMNEGEGEDMIQLFDTCVTKSVSWDRNQITPGTEFMQKVNFALHFYAIYKLNTNANLKRVRIIVDDASVPGEGEHKIVGYIRKQKQDPHYKHSTTHVIHGLDADLVLLALALHIPNVYILREDVFAPSPSSFRHPLHIFDIDKLRWSLCSMYSEALDELSPEFDNDRLITDFIMLCTLCGNDFLPHLPGLVIKENALGYLASHHINHLKEWAKVKDQEARKAKSIKRIVADDTVYMTQNSEVNVPVLLSFLRNLGLPTDEYLRKKLKARPKQQKHSLVVQEIEPNNRESDQGPKFFVSKMKKKWFTNELLWLTKNHPEHMDDFIHHHVEANIRYNTFREDIMYGDLEVEDWKTKYYSAKHRVEEKDVPALRQSLITHYLEGVAWVLAYYTVGVRSWTWFFPHHFSPLISDFSDTSLDFSLKPLKLGSPLKPFAQLISVLPKKSFHCIPEQLRKVAIGENAPLAQYFPDVFVRDPDNAKVEWKAVALLPFVDVEKVKSFLKENEQHLTPQEKYRNSFGHSILYFNKVSNTHMQKHYDSVKDLHQLSKHSFKLVLKSAQFFRVDSQDDVQFSGYTIALSDKHPLSKVIPKPGSEFNKKSFDPFYFIASVSESNVTATAYFPPAFPVLHFYMSETGKSIIESKFKQRRVVTLGDPVLGDPKNRRNFKNLPADTIAKEVPAANLSTKRSESQKKRSYVQAFGGTHKKFTKSTPSSSSSSEQPSKKRKE